MVKRLATLVGCNYANTLHELHGCINDVLAMREVLINRFGFMPKDIELLTDAPESQIKPTGSNIKRVLGQMIDLAKPGDILLFHYSGHGTLIPLTEDGPKKYDEAIVPCDFNLITDVDFRILINRLPEGASFTIISDSCHSGGLIDKEQAQIVTPVTNRQPRPDRRPHERPRNIIFDWISGFLHSIHCDLSIKDHGLHLAVGFKNEASAKYLPPSFHFHPLPRAGPDNGILLSGCQADQVSADMNSNGDGLEAHGAFTQAILEVLNSHQGVISNRILVTLAREVLLERGFNQNPCLYCSDTNADAPFLSAR